ERPDARLASNPKKHQDCARRAGRRGYRRGGGAAFADGRLDRIAAIGTESTVERTADENPAGRAADESAGESEHREPADRGFLQEAFSQAGLADCRSRGKAWGRERGEARSNQV